MDPIEQLLNQMVQNMLPQINSSIQGVIKSNNLDPWGQIAHGSDCLGAVDLGICDASVNANYNVGNMRGLSSISINGINLSGLQTNPDDPTQIFGTIHLTASLGADLSAHVNGGIEARCGIFHPNIDLGGSATVSGTRGSAAGTFTASLKDDQVCLNSITMSDMGVSYNNVNIDIDGLGFFNSFLRPLINAITGLFQGPITGAIASALKPLLSSEINKALPLCQKM